MFAPKIAKQQPKTAARSINKLAPRRSTLNGQFRGGADLLQCGVDQGRFLQKRNAPGRNSDEQEARRLVNHRQVPLRESGSPSWDFGKISIFPPVQQASFPALRLQGKLAIGAVDDPLEREADHVAEQVMRMPDVGLSIAPAPAQISLKCAAWEEEDKKLKMKPAGLAEQAPPEAPAIVHDVLRSPGQPLDLAARTFFEPRFGRDFSQVRVHVDANAAASARAMNALAYTFGRDLVFAEGRYAPLASEGRPLLAHELTHSIQQGAATAADRSIQRQPDDSAVTDTQPLASEQGPVSNPAPTGPQRAMPACSPVIVNPTWDVGSGVLDTSKGPCTLHGWMRFSGTVSIPAACPGTVYFVQYAQPSRSFVSCLPTSEELGSCSQPLFGVDTSWPYLFGTRVDTRLHPPGSLVPIKLEDAPGISNISDPTSLGVRECMDDWYTTYIVFEDAAGVLTSLGWMSWGVGAGAQRDDGTCPRKTTTNDCTGWNITIATSSKASNFAVGAMAPGQPLDRSVAIVNKASLVFLECDPAACSKAVAL